MRVPARHLPMSDPWKTVARRSTVVVLVLLLLADVAESIRVVWYRHQARTLSMQLNRLRSDRDALQYEYGRLLLEQATYADPHVVEARATEELGMRPLPVLRLIRGQPRTPNWPIMIERARQTPAQDPL